MLIFFQTVGNESRPHLMHTCATKIRTRNVQDLSSVISRRANLKTKVIRKQNMPNFQKANIS